jgi:hypothetical protein
LQSSKQHITTLLRSKLPAEKQEASWGYLAEQFPWYPVLHLLRAAEHPTDSSLLQKAALYNNNVPALHFWIHQQELPATPLKSALAYGEAEKKELATGETNGIEAEPVLEINPDLEEVDEIIAEQAHMEAAQVDATPANEMKTTIKVEENGEEEPSDLPEDALHLPGLAKLLDQPVDENTPLLIEAYHTIDYFASQGIKVDREADKQMDTQLDKQVKSFTDWLKTMKKLSYQPKVSYTDPLVEVQAKSSLTNREIITEAMAEVWIKQGNFTNAAKVYTRLMLLHPEKTPYFAARLQDLKTKQ